MASTPPADTVATEDIVVTGQRTAYAGQLSPAQLLTLGMFVFGMDTAAYSELSRRMSWNHSTVERHMARPATQFTGPGEDSIQIAGLIAPEVAGSFGAFDELEAMANTGDAWPLLDGRGFVLGVFQIVALDRTQRTILAGGLPRVVDFTLDLVRVD